MTAEDTRVVLRGDQIGLADDLLVDHLGQPVDYFDSFPDGPVWTWHHEWREVGGVRLRVYDLVVSIVLLGGHGRADDRLVDHPGQPADYTHMDGTVWTWRRGWRLVGGSFGRIHTHVRAYVLADTALTTPDPVGQPIAGKEGTGTASRVPDEPG